MTRPDKIKNWCLGNNYRSSYQFPSSTKPTNQLINYNLLFKTNISSSLSCYSEAATVIRSPRNIASRESWGDSCLSIFVSRSPAIGPSKREPSLCKTFTLRRLLQLVWLFLIVSSVGRQSTRGVQYGLEMSRHDYFTWQLQRISTSHSTLVTLFIERAGYQSIFDKWHIHYTVACS